MKILIKNAQIINEGKSFNGYISIFDEIINDVDSGNHADESIFDKIIDAKGKIVVPGVIDDQVHFREPGLIHKAEIYTETKAAIAGGVTSYMEMPNTNPQTTTQLALKTKYDIAAEKSLANYSFYIGATNDNLSELLKTNPKTTPGIKVFMGSSTGNMLVDDEKTLEGIFKEAPCLVATHCEDEKTIRNNLNTYINKYGNDILPEHHPLIRSAEACYISSSKAVELATKFNSKLHVLHLSTEKEMSLFNNGNIEEKSITAEVCVHHLWFNADDYKTYGNRIKWNPSVKFESDRNALFNALVNDKIDVVATDHAPHLLNEKLNAYTQSASGGPLVQHSLLAMLDFYHNGKISIETIVKKMCHSPATLYNVDKRGFIKKDYYADIVIIDTNSETTVNSDNILYKCKWSPFEGHTFKSRITHTFVNGNLVYENGMINENIKGKPLQFNR